MFRYRFLILLALLLLLLVVAPLATTVGGGFGSRLLVEVVFMAILLSAALSVSERRVGAVVAWVLASASLLVNALGFAYGAEALAIAEYVLGSVVLFYVIMLIVRYLFRGRRVTPNTIYAALCVYLLMGVFWAMVYSLMVLFDPTAFALSAAQETAAEMQFGRGTSVNPIYYSYVTLTTLGYGDVVPISPVAKMLAVTEAIIGQLYIAVLVARLVGLHISQSVRPD